MRVNLNVSIDIETVIIHGVEMFSVNSVGLKLNEGEIVRGNIIQVLNVVGKLIETTQSEHLDDVLHVGGRITEGYPRAMIDALRDINANSDVQIELNNQKDEEIS